MTPAAQQSASAARTAREVRQANKPRNHSRRPPRLPLLPPGSTPRLSLGSSKVCGAPEIGLSAALPEAPLNESQDGARREEGGRGFRLGTSGRHRWKQPAKGALVARDLREAGRAWRWWGRAGLFAFTCVGEQLLVGSRASQQKLLEKLGAEGCNLRIKAGDPCIRIYKKHTGK
jgi:hypothetical protein